MKIPYKIRNALGRGASSNSSLLLPYSVDFKEGVPYRITVTAISPWGLAPALARRRCIGARGGCSHGGACGDGGGNE